MVYINIIYYKIFNITSMVLIRGTEYEPIQFAVYTTSKHTTKIILVYSGGSVIFSGVKKLNTIASLYVIKDKVAGSFATNFFKCIDNNINPFE